MFYDLNYAMKFQHICWLNRMSPLHFTGSNALIGKIDQRSCFVFRPKTMIVTV
jgi:hypothetical protein